MTIQDKINFLKNEAFYHKMQLKSSRILQFYDYRDESIFIDSDYQETITEEIINDLKHLAIKSKGVCFDRD